MRPAAEPVRDGLAEEFAPLAALSPQVGISPVGLRRMAVEGKIPGARRLGTRWVVCLAVFRKFFGETSPSAPRDTVPARAPEPRRRGRPRTHSDLDRVYSSGYTRDTSPGRV